MEIRKSFEEKCSGLFIHLDRTEHELPWNTYLKQGEYFYKNVNYGWQCFLLSEQSKPEEKAVIEPLTVNGKAVSKEVFEEFYFFASKLQDRVHGMYETSFFDVEQAANKLLSKYDLPINPTYIRCSNGLII